MTQSQFSKFKRTGAVPQPCGTRLRGYLATQHLRDVFQLPEYDTGRSILSYYTMVHASVSVVLYSSNPMPTTVAHPAHTTTNIVYGVSPTVDDIAKHLKFQTHSILCDFLNESVRNAQLHGSKKSCVILCRHGTKPHAVIEYSVWKREIPRQHRCLPHHTIDRC